MSLPSEFSLNEAPPDMIFGYVSPRSLGGVAIPEAELTAATSVESFFSAGEVASAARQQAEQAGLSITAESRAGLRSPGPPRPTRS